MGEYAPDDGFYGDKQEPIAIVGASCRFPGSASSMGNLWDMISRSRSAFGKVPSDRFDADAWYHPDPDRKGTVRLDTSLSFLLFPALPVLLLHCFPSFEF